MQAVQVTRKSAARPHWSSRDQEPVMSGGRRLFAGFSEMTGLPEIPSRLAPIVPTSCPPITRRRSSHCPLVVSRTL